MEREKKNRRVIVAVVLAAVLIVVILLLMRSCSSGKTTDPTDGKGEQLEHYPTAVVTKPTEGSEPAVSGETEPAETKPTEPAETEPTEPTETTEATEPTEGKPSDPVEPTSPKLTEPKPTEPKPTEPAPTTPKTTEPPTKPMEPPVTEHRHSFVVSSTTSATCTSDGVKIYTCSTCNDTYSESIPATGHTVQNRTVAATCTDGGYVVGTCSVCGVECSRTDTEPALGHIDVVTDRKDASCSSDGYVTYACSRCGTTHTNVTPALGHSWVHHHEDAEGYKEFGIECRCGWVCWESEATAAGYELCEYFQLFHVEQFESSKGHSCDGISRWVETKPAKDWKECSVCGKVG